MKDLLSNSLGPLQWALATPEGFPRKTNQENKAAFFQKNVKAADAFPPNSTTVIDGMSNPTTFENVANTLVTMALKEDEQSNRTDIVFDNYRKLAVEAIFAPVDEQDKPHQIPSD